MRDRSRVQCRAMPADVVNEPIIDRPIAAVVAYASDPNNTPAWSDNIQAVEWLTEPPVQELR